MAAWSLTFFRGHKAFLVFHAEQVIIGLPRGQGQLSRIWKVQCDWLSWRLSEGMKHELP